MTTRRRLAKRGKNHGRTYLHQHGVDADRRGRSEGRVGFDRKGVVAVERRDEAGFSLVGAENGPGAADRVTKVHGAILDAVVEQRLPPGTKLPEDQLASLFSVSRTLVRAALRSLAQDGIVVLARNRGASVASPSPSDARDLFDARRVVEAVTTLRAAAQATESDFLDLEAILHQGRDALAANDRGRAIRLSGTFHVRIAGVARQAVLEGFLKELVARSSLVIALYGHRGRSDCGDAEHTGLIEALRHRDGAQAVALMTEHLHHLEADLDLDRQARAALPLAKLLA